MQVLSHWHERDQGLLLCNHRVVELLNHRPPDSKRSSQDLLPRALISPPKHSMPQPYPYPSYCYQQYHYPPSPWSIPDYPLYQNPGLYYGQSSTSNTTSTVYEPSSSRHPFTPDYPSYKNPGSYYRQSSTSNTTISFMNPPPSRHPFTLKFINTWISKCQGGKVVFRKTATSIEPPCDLIVSRLECRAFVTPNGSVKVPTTPENSHYHLSLSCLTNADPYFQPQFIAIPEDVKNKLTTNSFLNLLKIIQNHKIVSSLWCNFWFVFWFVFHSILF